MQDIGTAFQIAGGSGNDTITAQGFAFSADQRNAIFATASVERIVDASGTYTASRSIAPTITSNGGGNTAAVSIAENTTAVTTVTATDPDAGQTLSYSIIGGADASKFTIGSSTGALSFVTAPNFELPTDAGGNNVYDVIVQASDGHGGIDTQAIAVTVTDVFENSAPTITSNGGGNTAAVSIAENTTAVTTVTATDPDAGQTLSYSIIGGADASKFTIGSTTGALSFITAPNFEAPTDAGGNNIYDLTVQVSDGNGGIDTQAIAVAVANANEAAVPSVTPLPLTGDLVIDATTHGYYWNLDSSRTIYWSIANGFNSEFWTNPSAVASTLQTAFSGFSYYANINFQYAGYFSDPYQAYLAGSNITVSIDGSHYVFDNNATWATGFFPNAQYNNVYPGLPGDIFLNLNSQANFLPSYAPGSAGFFLAIHEIGHTLGLKHPHDDGGTGSPTFTDLGISGLDIDWATIMSYNDDANWNLVSFDPATPMPLDVLALQYLYGQNQTTNSGNSVYTLPLNNLYATIWDPSGDDTIDVSSSPVAWTIALPNVQLSELVSTLTGFALPTNEFQIAVPQNLYWLMGNIENVIGSKYDDTLSGNDIANLLVGGEGSDTLAGGAGADTFVFDLTALTPAQPGSAIVDHILDYNQGNSGIFNPAEGDTFDFSALLSAGSGQPVGNLVRVLENPSGTAAILQIDQDGAANGAHWTTIAQLDGVHTGDGVKVIFDASQPAATLTAPALVPTHNFNGDGKSDILWQNDNGTPAIWTDGWHQRSHWRRGRLANPGPSWHVEGTGDFNGDGKSDILWQNDNGTPRSG